MAAASQGLAAGSPAFDAQHDRDDRRGTIREQGDGTSRGDGAQIIPFRRAPVHDIDNYRLTQRWGDALDADTMDCKAPVKKIAAAADCNLRTAENYKRRLNLPNFLQGMRLAASPDFPHVRALVIELLALESTGRTPQIEKALNDLMLAWNSAQRTERAAPQGE